MAPTVHPDPLAVADLYQFGAPAPFIYHRPSAEVLPPRHRSRKKRDDDVPALTNGAAAAPALSHHANGANNAPAQAPVASNGSKSQFDLVDAAFPPLPGEHFLLSSFRHLKPNRIPCFHFCLFVF